MAIHRAAHLANPDVRNSGPVLLVTYTRSLVAYLCHLVADQTFPMQVETYGRFARGYLNSVGYRPAPHRTTLRTARPDRGPGTKLADVIAEIHHQIAGLIRRPWPVGMLGHAQDGQIAVADLE